ncbi:MAG: winged helix-turn-helix domain-containing protein [Candidatus Omnitrophica bacterium]|nr:winged helix-turn-helix domain-containing protein [Candidatus Omnitrophota bacterium]
MKEKIIETAGKTWRFLGQNGETNVSQLSKGLKEKDELVLQAIGWLAREDKINYSIKNRRTFVSLVDQEARAFNNVMYNMGQQAQSAETSNGKAKTRK